MVQRLRLETAGCGAGRAVGIEECEGAPQPTIIPLGTPVEDASENSLPLNNGEEVGDPARLSVDV
jgi:hypothetical protein